MLFVNRFYISLLCPPPLYPIPISLPHTQTNYKSELNFCLRTFTIGMFKFTLIIPMHLWQFHVCPTDYSLLCSISDFCSVHFSSPSVLPPILASLAVEGGCPSKGATPFTRHSTLHCTLLHCAWLYCTTIHYNTVHCTLLHCVWLYWTTTYYTALHCTLLHCAWLCCTTIHYTALYCTLLHCAWLYWTTIHYTTVHCTLLRCAWLCSTTIHYTTVHCTHVGRKLPSVGKDCHCHNYPLSYGLTV